MEPSAEELERMATVGAILTWAQIPGPPATATSPQASLLALLGAAVTDHPRVVAAIPEGEFTALVSTWQVDETAASPALRAKAENVGLAARVKTGKILPVEERRAAEQAAAKAAAAKAASPPVVATHTGIAKFKMSSVANQTSDVELTILEGDKIKEAYENYRRIFGDVPPPDEELSTEQLTAIKTLLDADVAPYVDFAVWGPHSYRLMRKHRLSGSTFTADGLIVPVEIMGPPNFDQWIKSFKCLRTGLLSWNAVSLGRLDAYSDMMARYHSRYGAAMWHILYQADVRCRSEHMERIRRRGEEELANGGARSMDKAKPWDWVFAEATKDAQFWHVELEEPALLMLNRTKRANEMLGDEAPVGAPPTGGKRPGGGREGETPPKTKRPNTERVHNVEGNNFTTNRRGIKLCASFQEGTCETQNGKCPNGAGAHQCSRCLDFKHGLNACVRTDYPATTMPKWAAAGGKGKGKGKKGKGRGNWQY